MVASEAKIADAGVERHGHLHDALSLCVFVMSVSDWTNMINIRMTKHSSIANLMREALTVNLEC